MHVCLLNSAVLILAIALSGCGRHAEGVVPVRGMVTFEGKPVPGLSIHFTPNQGQGRTSAGKTAADGSFEMYLTRRQKGVQPGVHRVTLGWFPQDEETARHGPSPEVKKFLKSLEQKDPVEFEIKKPELNLRIALP